MKKITFLLTTALFLTSANRLANADSYHYSPYMGIDYTYNRLSAKNFHTFHDVAGVHIGSEYSQYFSTELFFNQSDSRKKRLTDQTIKTSYRSYGLDLLAYLPLGCQKKFSILATAGMGEYVIKSRLAPEKHHNEHGFGFRFGGGLKYAFDAHWHARLLTRYVKFNHVHNFDHAVEYSAGLEYHF